MRSIVIDDLHIRHAERDRLLAINNASALETSLLTREKFDRMIAAVSVAGGLG
jgi:predicted GNAT superfamily acetyltransferase